MVTLPSKSPFGRSIFWRSEIQIQYKTRISRCFQADLKILTDVNRCSYSDHHLQLNQRLSGTSFVWGPTKHIDVVQATGSWKLPFRSRVAFLSPPFAPKYNLVSPNLSPPFAIAANHTSISAALNPILKILSESVTRYTHKIENSNRVNDDSPMDFMYGYPIFGQTHMAFRTTSTATFGLSRVPVGLAWTARPVSTSATGMRLGSIRPTFGATEILPVDHTMNHKTCRVDILSDHTSPGKTLGGWAWSWIMCAGFMAWSWNKSCHKNVWTSDLRIGELRAETQPVVVAAWNYQNISYRSSETME